jgi:4-hydroxy-tetrahydrodipicolinate synthase
MQEACLKGDYAAALAVQDRLVPLHAALFIEPNPAGPKYALSALGRTTDEVRLPMVPLTEATRGAIRSAMAHAGLLNA